MPELPPDGEDLPGRVDPSAPLPIELDPRGRRAARAAAQKRAAEAAGPAASTKSASTKSASTKSASTKAASAKAAGPVSAPRSRANQSGHSRARSGAMVATKILAAALSLAVVVGSFWVWSTWRQFNADIATGAALPPVTDGKSGSPAKDIDGKDQNILLLGNDSRAGATPAELAALGTQDDGGSANTDTMMIMHIPADGSRATVISLPRDSYVDIPGYGMAKLNAAYPDGYNAAKGNGASEVDAESAGIAVVVQTLTELTGLHIDHYAMINLLGFYRISNAIQGVPVVLCQPQQESNSGIDLPAGLSYIQGSQALAFVRQRDGLPLGDLDRIKRQQYFLTAVFHKVTSSGTLLNPFKVNSLLKAVSSSLLIDPKLDVLALANDFQQMSSGNLVFKTIPTDGFANNDAGSVVVVTPSEVQAFVEALVGAASDPNLSKAATVAPSSVTVDVLNGSNQNGAAAQNATTLTADGFVVGTVGSTDATATTTIEYAPGQEAQAKTLSAVVAGAQLVQDASVQHVTLVLGADGLQVSSSAAATTAPAATTPAATTTAPAAPTKPVPNVPNQPGCIN